MDPMEYFTHCLDLTEMIFQHFSGNELIKFSETCAFWYNFIGGSRKLMKKIKIVMKTRVSGDVVKVDLLKNSPRKYQSFEMSSCRYLTSGFSNNLMDILSAPKKRVENHRTNENMFSIVGRCVWNV